MSTNTKHFLCTLVLFLFNMFTMSSALNFYDMELIGELGILIFILFSVVISVIVVVFKDKICGEL